MSISEELNLESPMRDLRHEVALNVVRTASVMSSAAATLLRNFRLTEAQFNVLFALKYNPTHVTQSDLGKRLVVTRASITSVLDKLEQKGLVRRVAVTGDRRVYHVVLTDGGMALLDEVEPQYRARLHEATEVLTDAECREMIAGLERLRSHITGSQDGLGRPVEQSTQDADSVRRAG